MRNFCISALLFCLLAAGLTADDEDFAWDLQFFKYPSGESMAAAAVNIMQAEEQFGFTLRPLVNAYCYVAALKSNQNVEVLYPASLSGYRPINAKTLVGCGPYKMGQEPGTDFLFIIVSRDRQHRLEEKMKALQQRSSDAGRMQAVLAEIFQIQDAVKEGGEAPSIPVTGAFSSDVTRESPFPPDVAETIRYSDRKNYVKVITISH